MCKVFFGAAVVASSYPRAPNEYTEAVIDHVM